MDDTDTKVRKQRTITLTDARPVTIYEDEWPGGDRVLVVGLCPDGGG